MNCHQRKCQTFLLSLVWLTVTNGIVIEKPIGPVKGSVEYSIEGQEFYSFKGIPYAEPPIGKLRFMKPLPKKPWTDVLEANHHEMCVQVSFFRRGTLVGKIRFANV